MGYRLTTTRCGLIALSGALLGVCSCGVYRPVEILLESEEVSSQPAPIVQDLGGCAAATHGFEVTFNNRFINGEIAVTVKGPSQESHPQIEVVDFNGNVVVEPAAAESHRQRVTFTPLTTTIFTVRVNECGPVIGPATYRLKVTQAQ